MPANGIDDDEELEDNASDHSMNLINDPRLIQPNVLDKRLLAFTAQVGFVGGLTTGASLGQCFGLQKHLVFGYCNDAPWWKILQSVLLLLSFFGMSTCVCLSLYSTLVSVNQAYFGNRLMTAGTNGFELARRFYMDPDLARMRHRAVSYLARALLLLLLSAGGLLYVKFAEDQDVEAGYEIGVASNGEAPVNYAKANMIDRRSKRPDEWEPFFCSSHIHPAGVGVILLFCAVSWYLYRYIQLPHERAFKEIYAMRYQQGETFDKLLEAVMQDQKEEEQDARQTLKRSRTRTEKLLGIDTDKARGNAPRELIRQQAVELPDSCRPAGCTCM